MHFVINNSNPFQNFVRANEVLWRLYSRQYKFYFTFVLIVAIIMALFGASSKHTFWVATSNGGVYYNLNIAYSLSLTFLILAIIYFRHMLKCKREFFKIADQIASELPDHP